MITIRAERPGDVDAIRHVNEAAFDGPTEAQLVDALRQSGAELLSLVAVSGDEIVGHVLFSPVTGGGGTSSLEGMGLAPMAVVPDRQGNGIGSALVERGLAALREQGCPFVIVLGHPGYYPRFGFEPASRHGIECQWPGVPDEAFRVLILDERVRGRLAGVARYREEFDAAM